MYKKLLIWIIVLCLSNLVLAEDLYLDIDGVDVNNDKTQFNLNALQENIKEKDIVDAVDFTANIGGEDTLEEVVTRLRTVTYYVRVGGAVFAGQPG